MSRQREANGIAAGAAAGAAAHQGSYIPTKIADNRYEGRIRNDPAAKSKINAHRKTTGVSGKPNGDPTWKKFFRTYPTDVPGGRLKRVLSRTHGGKSGFFVGTSTIGAGAEAGRRLSKDPVVKTLSGKQLSAAKARAAAAGRRYPNAYDNMKSAGKFSKREDNRNGRQGAAMTASGSVLAGTGLVAGGVPGANARRGPRLPGPKGKPVTGGILGVRGIAHEDIANGMKAKVQSNPLKQDLYSQGHLAGKIDAETKVMRGMKVGRRATYPLTAGGAALAIAGRKKARDSEVTKSRRSENVSAGAAAGGATLTGIGVGVPAGLRATGRRYGNASIANVNAARDLRPGLKGSKQTPPSYDRSGGLKKAPKDVMYPTRTDKDIFAKPGNQSRNPGARRQAGVHRGKAAQQRYFAEVFNRQAKLVSHARVPGLALGAAGAAGLAHSKREKNR